MNRVLGMLLGALFVVSPANAGSSAPDYDWMAAAFRSTLNDLVAADTSNPPGNEAKAVAIGAAQLKAAGIPFETFEFAPGRQNLVARLKGEGSLKPLLLLAHIDVVGASGQNWTSPPHTVTAKDGFLVGRGVNDDLGMAVLELQVFLKLKNVRLRRDVILAWTGDEESGGAGIRWILDHRRDVLGDPALTLNEGGGLQLGPDGKKMKLVGIQTAEKVYQDFSFTARGTTGHSSIPLDDNAIYRLSRALDRIGQRKFPARLIPTTRAYFEQRAKLEPAPLAAAMRAVAAAKGDLPPSAVEVIDRDPLMAANLRTTCVATMVKGGTRENALPADAVANVNCRILPDETVEQVKQRLVALTADPEVEIKAVGDLGQAGDSPVEGEGPDAIRKIVAAMYPGVPVVPWMSRGSSDSRFLRGIGIPSYGIAPIATTEADGRRDHGIDERIPEKSIRPGAEFLYRLVIELAAKR